MTDENDRKAGKEGKRTRRVTPGFTLRRHLGAFGALVTIAVLAGSWLALSARLSDLWIVPAYLLLANVVENLVHRFPMHRPIWPRVFFRNHTPGHHRAFHHDSMPIENWPELELVMMPWFTVGLFCCALAPLTTLIAVGMTRGAAGLFLLTAIGSFVLYEGLHALYHFPVPVLGRMGLLESRVFRFLYRHHRHHHRLNRMRWVNFNISIPLSDWLLGTLETEAAWEARRPARMEDRAAR